MALSNKDRVSSSRLQSFATKFFEVIDSNFAKNLDVVHKENDEYIVGQKTFNSDPIVQNYDATKPTKIVLMKSNGTDNENIQLRYDTSGKRGLYDNYNSDWIVYCGTDNVPTLKGLAEKATKDGAGNTISTYYLSKSDAESKYVNNDAIVTEIEGIGDDSEIPSTSAVMAAINNIDINGTYLQNGSNIDTMHTDDNRLIPSGFYYLSQNFRYGGTFPTDYNNYGFLEFKRISISGLWIQTFHPAGYNDAVFTRQRNTLAGGTLTPWVKSSN